MLSRASAISQGRLGLAALICTFFVIVLLISSFTPLSGALATSYSAHNSADGLGSSSKDLLTPNSPAQRLAWDWNGFADEQGYVDVIVSWSDQAQAADSHSAKSQVLMDKFGSGMKEHYSKAFKGFSSRVSLNLVNELLQSGDDSIQIYPDVRVNATVADNIAEVGANQVWTRTDTSGTPITGVGIVVAVIDTGVDYTHPDLGGGFGRGFKVIGGYDFHNGDSDPMDDNGHGTHVAGIIAANGILKGVAPGASILAYKALGADGSGSISDVILAIDRAIDPNQDGDTSDHADIISMSLGGKGQSDDPVCQAVESAISAGVVVVAAAGNDGPSLGTVASPGLAPDAITVGAIDGDGVLANFSSRGTSPSLSIKPEVSAPGVSINSTVPFSNAARASPTGYAVMSGTSMATPHVSGGAALLLQMHPAWTPLQVKSALISGAAKLRESVWTAGAGGMWIPTSIDSKVFFNPAIVSYGLAGNVRGSVSISYAGSGTSLSLDSVDYSSVTADGHATSSVWTNISTVNPSTVSVQSGTYVSVSLSVPVPSTQAPEGYYDGEIRVSGGLAHTRIPFGFAVLSRLNVHVMDLNGKEVSDPSGGVWVYEDPSASVAVGARGSLDKPAPPASFLLPSGRYSAHSFGHQLLYQFSDPYILSAKFDMRRLETKELYLNMTSARAFTLDLKTDDSLPIFVKDYRVYGRHEGANNVSFHLVGSDYSIQGSDIFSLPQSKTIYISDTDIRIGIAISGFSYTPAMWDFMSRNWQHWYEYAADDSTVFHQEASADLQYLMAWEFDGIDSSSNRALKFVPGLYSIYDTKYDIPGMLDDVWGDWGRHRSIGGDSAFYVRRDTDTSLNSFFSGMTRRTIVQGVFTELYFPGDLFQGYVERQFYSPDYSTLVKANLAADVYLPDRNFLTSLDGVMATQRLGAGPFYPSIVTENTADSFVLYQPIIRDQAGAKVGGMSVPSMSLYRGAQLNGVYQLAEHLARPDAKRIITLSETGTYTAKIEYSPVPQICGSVNIELGFTVPGADMNPPLITGLRMSERFVPGDRVSVTVNAMDKASPTVVTMFWRPGSTSPWTSLSVIGLGNSAYSSSIQTATSTTAIDLMIKATDASGNYLQYTAKNAAEKQIPVVFDLSTSSLDIGYKNGDASVLLTGTLTDGLGSPLHPTAGIPIELTINGRKVAMILDEYVQTGTHSHNGAIRFEWHFNPMYLFSGPNETVNIDAAFDLGVYQPVHRTITLRSIYCDNPGPVITLVSPADGAIIPAGQIINLEISSEGPVHAQMRLDGHAPSELNSPWDINTSSWAAEDHVLEITATDDQLASVTSTFKFHIDRTYPVVRILSPMPGWVVPLGWTLTAEVSDDHLSQVTYKLDGGALQPLSSPYSVNLTGEVAGIHTVVIEAVDLAGHRTSNATRFEIVASPIVVNLISPQNDDVIRSGVPITFSVLSMGTCANSWQEYGSWHPLDATTSISTTGWTEGRHAITINSTDDRGGWAELSFSLTIDDTPPTITLVSPANRSFVSADDVLTLRISDVNYKSITWIIWGKTYTSASNGISISLLDNPGDGRFTVDLKAVDEAGNEHTDLYTFDLDTQSPALSYCGVLSGQSVDPTQIILVNASDAFLSGVEMFVDSSSSPMYLEPPYQFNCSSMSLEWHTVQLFAYDYSGKSTNVSLSLYVDSIAPTITTVFFSDSTPSSSALFQANITDDFAIVKADLYYELPNGSFSSIPLWESGSMFSGTIPAGNTWDGMAAYVIAYDSAGHSTTSNQVVLNTSGAGIGGDPAPSDDSGSVHSLSALALALASIGVVSISIVLCLMLLFGTSTGDIIMSSRRLVVRFVWFLLPRERETTRVIQDQKVISWPTQDPVVVNSGAEKPEVAELAEPVPAVTDPETQPQNQP